MITNERILKLHRERELAIYRDCAERGMQPIAAAPSDKRALEYYPSQPDQIKSQFLKKQITFDESQFLQGKILEPQNTYERRLMVAARDPDVITDLVRALQPIQITRTDIAPDRLRVGDKNAIQLVLKPYAIGKYSLRLRPLAEDAARFSAYMATHGYVNGFVDHLATSELSNVRASTISWHWHCALTPPRHLRDRDAEYLPFRVAQYHFSLSRPMHEALNHLKEELTDNPYCYEDTFVFEADADILRAPMDILADQSALNPSRGQFNYAAGPAPLRALRIYQMNSGPVAEVLAQPATRAVEFHETL